MPARKAKTAFDQNEFPGLASNEARQALESALDSFSNWRDEIVATTERNADKAFDAMAEAAQALGWPADVVSSLKLQMESATEFQVQYMDSVMNAWVQHIKNPGQQMADPRDWFSNVPPFNKTFAGLNNPNLGAMGFNPALMANNPFQYWMQGAELWQKAWMQAFAGWTEMQKTGGSRK